jgi:transposase-like protein
MHHRRPHSTTAHSERLEQLAAAIDAYRGNKPRRRLSPGLRAQVVTAIDAGATVRAVREACKLSATQIGRWRQAAALSGDDAVSSSATAVVSPRVLSVVDRDNHAEGSQSDDEIELRIGGWHISLRRTAR